MIRPSKVQPAWLKKIAEVFGAVTELRRAGRSLGGRRNRRRLAGGIILPAYLPGSG